MKEMSKKHTAFIDEYLRCFNATDAYLRVYPKSSRDAARANAARLIATDSIKAEIDRRLAEVHMSADEALKLYADIARGDIGEFLNDFGGLDIGQARKRGLTKLIKKIKTKTVTINGKDEDKEITEEEIELYPADNAIRDILKIHGKFKDSVELPETLKIQIVKASDATTSSQ